MGQKIINFILISFLLFLPYYLVRELSCLDKAYFFCPIEYKHDTIIIRHDSYGSGDFMAERSGLRRHNGIDLQAKIGEPVLAVRGGKVIEARFHRGMGNYVELSHPGGHTTIYGHLSKIEARQGQAVRQGDKIGEVGKTGNANHRSIMPHLHFEIRKKNVPLDPMEFLE